MDTNELKDKAKFLFDRKIITHVDTKDRSYYNGLIIELHETFIVLLDRVLGETPISFSEIKSIDRYKGRSI